MTASPPILLGLELADVDVWSERVVVALGQNPGIFTGPGTNTYLVGTGSQRILLDTGDGRPDYLPVLERALARAGCDGLQEVVISHAHPDHIGGVSSVIERFGPLSVKKRPWPGVDERYDVEITPIDDGDTIRTEGATLRALHTPGHAPDHLCFALDEERTVFSGDDVLGVGTTVIPFEGGSLLEYMASLERLLDERPRRIYPAHGPCIEDGCAKLREYIDHRMQREEQILDAVRGGAEQVSQIVKVVYAAYPEALYAAAGQSVASHLLKLEAEGRIRRSGTESGAHDPLAARWALP